MKSKKRIQYGYFEARCRSMKAGVCNAFWLYDPLDPPAKYREGSFSEEIDIFEIYGFLWPPTEMKWFVDGREVFARDNDYYHTALYIMFDCEVMQDWVGLPDPADLPSTFSIDYLRVWRSPAQPFPNATGL